MNKSVATLLTAMTLVVLAGPAGSENHQSPYAGQEHRSIKSFSEDDIEQLRSGAGWGFAKAAELNGLPGPKHVLDLNSEIALTPEQELEIWAVFDEMRQTAIVLGQRLVELERELDAAFATRSVTTDSLAERLARIAVVRRDLRYTHLAAHLRTTEILSPQQIGKYNRLRGYDQPNPCARVPAGHDASMWRRHNGCD